MARRRLLTTAAMAALALTGPLAGPALDEAIGTGWALTLLAAPALALAIVYGVREGGLRFAIPPFAPAPEPEVAAHGIFGVPSQSDLLPDSALGGRFLEPRLRRLV